MFTLSKSSFVRLQVHACSFNVSASVMSIYSFDVGKETSSLVNIHKLIHIFINHQLMIPKGNQNYYKLYKVQMAHTYNNYDNIEIKKYSTFCNSY